MKSLVRHCTSHRVSWIFSSSIDKEHIKALHTKRTAWKRVLLRSAFSRCCTDTKRGKGWISGKSKTKCTKSFWIWHYAEYIGLQKNSEAISHFHVSSQGLKKEILFSKNVKLSVTNSYIVFFSTVTVLH